MAIIYTYPKLTNPQGNELIVVSDVNNKNATRLITIADIASLVPGGGGGGCTSAISGILTGAGSYIPPLCNEVTFTGSGIDISANQATGTVTFTVPPVTIQCADQDRNVGGIAVEPGFLGTPTASETGSIYPIQVTDDCVAAVRIPDSQVELSCATTNQIGGIKAYPTQTESGDWPQPSEQGTYYPLEAVTFLEAGPGSTCMGAVKIPDSQSYVLPCATATVLGGIKATKVTTAVPQPADSGSYYPIQVLDEVEEQDVCRAVVRVPSTEPYTLPCATTTERGGIKVASTGSQVNPEITELESSPLAVEVNADCEAYVQVPTAATPGNGQITITAGTGLTGGGSFTVNQAGASTITLNASASGGGETGWSPMTITNSATTLPVQETGPLTLLFHATADATLDVNSIKMMLTDVDGAGNANKDDEFSVALYTGSLTDVANGGPTPTLIGSWSYTPGAAAVYGIKKVFNEVATSVIAGNDYIIGVSVTANGAQLLGDGVIYGANGSLFMANQYLCIGNNNLYGTTLGAEWPTENIPDTTFNSSFRYAIHFYEGGEAASEGEGESSGEGEVEEKEG